MTCKCGMNGSVDVMSGRVGVMDDMTGWLVGIDHMTGRMGVMNDMTDWLVGIDHTTGMVDGCSFFSFFSLSLSFSSFCPPPSPTQPPALLTD